MLEKQPDGENDEAGLKADHLGSNLVQGSIAGGRVQLELKIGRAEKSQVGAQGRDLHAEVGHQVLVLADSGLESGVGGQENRNVLL
jgi:hypothetical protein